MSAAPRDLLKNHNQRRAEVFQLLALKAGQANSQLVINGCTLAVGGTNTQFAVAAGEVCLGQADVNIAAVPGTVVPVGATLAAGQFVKVLIELTAGGAVSTKVGVIAGSQAAAPLPLGDTDKISIGWLELSGVFTPATTVLTGGMIKQMAYDAG